MTLSPRCVLRLDPGIWRDIEFVDGLSIGARSMWFTSLVYLTAIGDAHGTYPTVDLVSELGPLSGGIADELVSFGLWSENDTGYVVHEYCGCRVLPEVRRPITDEVRRLVYSRDDYRCVVCGSTEKLSCDHVIPWSHGGSDDQSNLQTMCISCNSRKGARV